MNNKNTGVRDCSENYARESGFSLLFRAGVAMNMHFAEIGRSAVLYMNYMLVYAFLFLLFLYTQNTEK